MRLSRNNSGTLESTTSWAKPLDDRGLADAGLAQEHRVVLGASRQDLNDALNFILPADNRIELALASQLRQVAAERIQRGGLAICPCWWCVRCCYRRRLPYFLLNPCCAPTG